MREEIGGVDYDDEAKLKFGSPDTRADFSTAKNPSPRANCCCGSNPVATKIRRRRTGRPGRGGQRGAAASRCDLKKLVAERNMKSGTTRKSFPRRRMARHGGAAAFAAGKAEIFAKEFERAGVPLAVARGGFYDSREILDLLSLLQLLDNPLQDVPCIAVLRSPLVGCSLDELAEIRLAAKDRHFWTALDQEPESRSPEVRSERAAKIEKFLERFSRWRKLAKQPSLSECLEAVLAETLYADWLRAQSARRATGREHRAFSGSRAAVRPVPAAGTCSAF